MPLAPQVPAPITDSGGTDSDGDQVEQQPVLSPKHVAAFTATQSQCSSKPAKVTWQSVACVSHTQTHCPVTGHAVTTTLRRAAWESQLAEHPDQQLVRALLHSITYGVDICHRASSVQTHQAANSGSCSAHKAFVRAELDEDLRSSRRIGPCTTSPYAAFKSSPLSVVQSAKADGSIKLRMVHDLSWPRASCMLRRSVNADVLPLECKLSSFDDGVAMVNSMAGHGGATPRHTLWLYKIDLKAAYRTIPVRVEDWPLLGCTVDKQLYFDKVLSFGLASSCAVFVAFADVAQWIVTKCTGVATLVHYVDDTLGAATEQAKAHSDFTAVVSAFRALGFQVADDKLVPPATCVEYLGICIDTSTWTLTLPPHKVTRIRDLLDEWHTRTSSTLRQLQSLCGILVWAAQVVKPGRIFLTRLYAATAVARTATHFNLGDDLKKDIDWWRRHFVSYHGVSAVPDAVWHTQADLQLYTDACGIGYGAVLGRHWLHAAWSAEQRRTYTTDSGALSMSMLELLALGHAVTSFGAAGLLRGRKVELHCDNSAAVQALQTGRCRNQQLASIARSMAHIASLYSFEYRVLFVRGVDNTHADMLSRNRLVDFHAQAAPGQWAEEPTLVCELPMQDW